MTDVEALLTKVYEAYNRRDFDALSANLHPRIDWPDQIAGGRLIGREAVRAYWARNDRMIQVESAPVTFTLLADGRTCVEVNQVVRNKAGQVWSDQCVRHCYTLHDGLISRMDMADDKEPSSAP
jgi:ketosteroid isomerase-like protein